MAYEGQIYYNTVPISLQEAVDRNLIEIDGDNNVWLFQDNNKIITIQGDLYLEGQ